VESVANDDGIGPDEVVEWEGGTVTWRRGQIDVELRHLNEVLEAQKRQTEALRADHEEWLRKIVFGLRYRSTFHEPDGVTWGEIGAALGCSRQAAQQRFGEWVDSEQARLYNDWIEWGMGKRVEEE